MPYRDSARGKGDRLVSGARLMTPTDSFRATGPRRGKSQRAGFQIQPKGTEAEGSPEILRARWVSLIGPGKELGFHHQFTGKSLEIFLQKQGHNPN